MQRRSADAPVRKCERLDLGVTLRGRVDRKSIGGEVIRHDMAQDMTLDKKEWTSRIRVEG